MSSRTTALAIGLVAGAGLSTGASAQSVVLTGLDDFGIKNVGEGLFGPTRRDATTSRFQINGRNPDNANRNFGLWSTFDLDFSGAGLNLSDLESVRVDLFQAQPTTGQDIDNIITGGTINVYFTLDSADVLDSANGFDWIDSDAEGLGDQFADRVLVGTANVVEGNFDVSFELDLSVIGDAFLNEINNDGFARLVFTTPDMDTATSFGVGVPSTSTILGFDGQAPTVTLTVPAPSGAAALAGVAMLATRRRR